MKAVRTLAVLLGLLLIQATAHAQNSGGDQYGNTIAADGDPVYYSTGGSAGAKAAPAAPGGGGLTWSGSYGLAPGFSVYSIQVVAIDVNNPANQFNATVTSGGGRWTANTGTLPGGTSYKLRLKYYTQDAFGNIYLSATLYSVAVPVP